MSYIETPVFLLYGFHFQQNPDNNTYINIRPSNTNLNMTFTITLDGGRMIVNGMFDGPIQQVNFPVGTIGSCIMLKKVAHQSTFSTSTSRSVGTQAGDNRNDEDR